MGWRVYVYYKLSCLLMEKGSQYRQVTEQLNIKLGALLEQFSNNTEWTDINNWLGNLEVVLKEYPSPFMSDKILLSKRLNQCINPILPQKLHEQVLNIHEILYYNMRASIDNDINQYTKLFAEELGTYSLSLLPYFAHSTVMQHRLRILQLLSDYYLDLGYQLLPMLQGIFKVMLPVYSETNNQLLLLKIQDFVLKLIEKSGRRYVISSIWSCVLKFSDCRLAGISFLGKLIPKMTYRKDEEEFQSSHGFSKQQQELKQQLQLQQMGVQIQKALPEHPRRPKSVHSNEENRMPFQFQIDKEFSFSQMELPQYITKKQAPQRRPSQKRRVKRSQTMVLPLNQFLDESSPPKKIDPNSPHNLVQQPEDIIIQKGEGSQSDQKPQVSDASLRQNSKRSGKRNSQNSKKFGKQKFSGLKLDKVPLMELPGIENIKQIGAGNVEQNNFPRHNTLVVNAILSCLDDASPFIKRSTLDFMFTHLRLKSDVLDEQDKKLLTQAMIRLFCKKQMSVIKRVDRWLLGRENQNGEYEVSEKNQFVLPLITNAFANILSKQPVSEKLCIVPIKIVQNFYMQHQNLIGRTMSQIFMVLIRYIFNYGEGFEFSSEIVKAGNRFFSNIPSHYPLLFRSLGKRLLDSIEENDDHSAYQCVRYIDYCYTKLMKHEHGVEELEYITITLQLLSQGLKTMSQFSSTHALQKVYVRDLSLLIFNLTSRRESVQRFMQKEKQEADKKFLAESGMLELPPERIHYQQTIKQAEEKQRQVYSQIAQNLSVFYVELGNIIRASPHTEGYEEVYRLTSMSMIKILIHLPTCRKIKELPVWFSAVQFGIRVASPSISLAAIDSLIKCLLYADRHPIYEQFKALIMDDKSKKFGNDYQNLALQKLWALLDYPHMHSKILDLIVAFSKFFPYEFTQTVQRSFQTHSDPEKQASIQRFSHFWRLTGFKYKDLLISNREFAELNKVGLFKMLDFLEDSNPLVRHAAKNWMIQSLPLFHRVIEPLFYQLMKAAGDWYVTPKNLIVIKEVYDTKIIFNTFRRIRCLLSSGTYSFLKYVYQKQISDSLEELRERVTHITEPILTDIQKSEVPSSLVGGKEAERSQFKRLTYIDMLLILSVRYIQGYTLESMGIDFYTGNTAVNTSAIELLQSLITYIDNPKICFNLIEFILPPLSSALSHSVTNQEFITQIQLLNLFKTIFFNSSFRKKGTPDLVRPFFSNIFTKTIFLGSMLNGLKTHFPYVRSQFVNFITTCIELIANFLEPNQCTKCIKQILLTYYKIIKQIRINLIEQVLDGEDQQNAELQIFDKNNQRKNKVFLAQIISLQIRALQEEKITKISNNIQEVAKANEILSILHGVSAVLNYFFDLDKMSIQDMKFSFENSFTFFDSFKSIFSLGLMSTKKNGRLAEKTQFLHNLETCQSILKDLSPVYETVLRAWPLSEQFVRIATEQFSSIGSRTFNFEKFGKYNKVLKDLIGFVSKQKQSVWGKIFSILQPMFYRFPRQIMDIYLHLWIRSCTNAGQGKKDSVNLLEPLKMKANVADTQFLMKNIQTIVVSNFPVNIIVIAFLESNFIEEIKTYYEQKKIEKRQSLTFRISELQAKLMYFLYVYFTYTHIDDQCLTKQNLMQIWGNILKALEPFRHSKSPSTALWVLDFINMCAIKYSPKEILSNQKFKTELHALINSQLKFIASIASKKEVVFYDDPTNSSFNIDEDKKLEKYRVVLPIPPTIFQIYKAGKNRKQTDNCILQAVKAGDFVQLQKINRLWCFRSLRKIGFEILQNTYLTEKMHFAVIRACEWMEIILPSIEDKSIENMIFAESASEVLYQLMEQSRLLFIKPLKPSIFRIFDKDDFFICNKNTLKYWAHIIDWIVSFQKNNQTFSLYLDKASLSNNYFTSVTTENKNRIKSFERICFILYSGAQDKYAHKIKGLLQKIADVIKQAEACHPGLLILVLFSIRILILRLSEISLNQLFIDIWPMILAFLMQIFSKKLVKVEIANEISKNPNLLLASLKLIEMISISNLSQFAHHQWIFVYDYFGVKLSLMQTTGELSEIFSERPELTQLATFSRSQVNSPFIYKPYMLNEIPQHSTSFIGEKKQEQLDYKAIERKIIIKESSVSNQESLKCYGYLLAQNLAHLNQYRMFADLKDVEEIIINDFISLDSFIFKP